MSNLTNVLPENDSPLVAITKAYLNFRYRMNEDYVPSPRAVAIIKDAFNKRHANKVELEDKFKDIEYLLDVYKHTRQDKPGTVDDLKVTKLLFKLKMDQATKEEHATYMRHFQGGVNVHNFLNYLYELGDIDTMDDSVQYSFMTYYIKKNS